MKTKIMKKCFKFHNKLPKIAFLMEKIQIKSYQHMMIAEINHYLNIVHINIQEMEIKDIHTINF